MRKKENFTFGKHTVNLQDYLRHWFVSKILPKIKTL